MKRYYLKTRLRAIWRILMGYDFIDFHLRDTDVAFEGVIADGTSQQVIDAFMRYIKREVAEWEEGNIWKT